MRKLRKKTKESSKAKVKSRTKTRAKTTAKVKIRVKGKNMPKKKQKKNQEIISSFILKTVTLSLIIGLNWAGLSAIGETLAYFFDNEDSNDNVYQAGILDFSLTNTNIEEFIGVELGEDIEFISVMTKTAGSLDIQYKVRAEKISGNDDFCNLLELEAFHSAILYDGLLLSFDTATTTALGTWAFEVKLPHTSTHIPHGAECNVDLVFKGWRSDVVNFEDSGFTDEERIELRLTSRMIVLNEFLPNPNGLVPDYGFDFGEDGDSKPQGEWVELYNNSDTSHNLDGWYIWDASSDASNKIFITESNTYPATTTIPTSGWLVVYMNKAVLDNTNTGDTIKLFDVSDTLVDSYIYTGDNDHCEIEPTPGDENTTDTSGICGGVPPNKSYARIPDGIGYWVDPIPTPGGPNRLIEKEIKELESEPEEITELEQEELTPELTDELIEEPGEESIEEPISDEIFDEIVGDEEPVEEPFGSAQGEEPIIEESLVNEEVVSEESTTEEELPVEETPTTEEEPITEEAPIIEEEIVEEPATEEEPTAEEAPIIGEEPIEEEVPTLGDEITIEETTETSGETTDDVIEELTEEVVEAPIIEEAPVEEAPVTEPVDNPSDTQEYEVTVEAPAVDEQPIAIPDDSSSIPDGAGGSVSDGESGGGGGETDVSLDGGSPVEGAGESSGDSGVVGEAVSE